MVTYSDNFKCPLKILHKKVKSHIPFSFKSIRKSRKIFSINIKNSLLRCHLNLTVDMFPRNGFSYINDYDKFYM